MDELQAESDRIDKLWERRAALGGPGPCREGDAAFNQARLEYIRAEGQLYSDALTELRGSLARSRDALVKDLDLALEDARASCGDPTRVAELERVQRRALGFGVSALSPSTSAPSGGFETPNLAAWSGTYTDSERTVTLQASGSSLSGDEQWTSPGDTFARHGGSAHWSACVVTGQEAACEGTGDYHDPDKTISTSAKVILRLDGRDLTITSTLTRADAAWRVPAYASAVHVGAVSVEHVTRQ